MRGWPGMPLADYAARHQIGEEQARERIVSIYLEAIEYVSRDVSGAALGALYLDLEQMPDRHLHAAARRQAGER